MAKSCNEGDFGHSYSSMKIACSGQFGLGESSQFERVSVQRAVANDYAIAEVVEVEDRWRDGETAALPLTDLWVNSYFHRPPIPIGMDLTTQ